MAFNKFYFTSIIVLIFKTSGYNVDLTDCVSGKTDLWSRFPSKYVYFIVVVARVRKRIGEGSLNKKVKLENGNCTQAL